MATTTTTSTTHPILWKCITIPLQSNKKKKKTHLQRPFLLPSLSYSSPLSHPLLPLRKRTSTAFSLSSSSSLSLLPSSSFSSFSSSSSSSSFSFPSSSSSSSSDKTQYRVLLGGAFPRSRWTPPVVVAASSSPALAIARLSHLPPLEQSLLFLGFFFCVITGTMVLLFILALPTLHALRRLAITMEKLNDVVREELPGTVASIKLSGREINDLTQELSHLRKRLQVKFPSGENRGELDVGKGGKSPIMN